MIIVAESPPVSGNYFYDPAGRPKELLFRALLRAFDINAATKADGLAAFARAGYVLVDATYRPVNHLTQTQRNRIILADYPKLVEDLRGLSRNHRCPILLLKANVCCLLDKKLSADGFTVMNHGAKIPFPGSGHQNEFQVAIARLKK